MKTSTVLFSLGTIFIVYTLWGYPTLLKIILWIRTKSADKKPKKNEQKELTHPMVTVVVPCFNESANLAGKINNIFITNYPKHLMEVIFVDNDSTDDTFTQLCDKSKEWPIQALKSSRGKTKALNQAMSIAKGDYIVNTDCDTEWDSDTLEKLVAGFNDPSIGAVCATPFIKNPIDSLKEKYHRQDWSIRHLESELDSCSNLDGRLMAFRRNAIQSFADDAAIDDFELTLTLRADGLRSVVLPDVFIYEECLKTVRDEFSQIRRRVFTVFLCLAKHYKMLFNLKYGFYGFVILPSRRLFPLFVPPALIFMYLLALTKWTTLALLSGGLVLTWITFKKRYFSLLQLLAISTGWFDFFLRNNRGDTWHRIK